jgi:hypothetical protein
MLQKHCQIGRLVMGRNPVKRLTAELFSQKIQPLLAGIANPVIMSALDVSVTYAVAIRAGRRRPHPRQWETLAQLAGVTGIA